MTTTHPTLYMRLMTAAWIAVVLLQVIGAMILGALFVGVCFLLSGGDYHRYPEGYRSLPSPTAQFEEGRQ